MLTLLDPIGAEGHRVSDSKFDQTVFASPEHKRLRNVRFYGNLRINTSYSNDTE